MCILFAPRFFSCSDIGPYYEDVFMYSCSDEKSAAFHVYCASPLCVCSHFAVVLKFAVRPMPVEFTTDAFD